MTPRRSIQARRAPQIGGSDSAAAEMAFEGGYRERGEQNRTSQARNRRNPARDSRHRDAFLCSMRLSQVRRTQLSSPGAPFSSTESSPRLGMPPAQKSSVPVSTSQLTGGALQSSAFQTNSTLSICHSSPETQHTAVCPHMKITVIEVVSNIRKYRRHCPLFPKDPYSVYRPSAPSDITWERAWLHRSLRYPGRWLISQRTRIPFYSVR